jgi:hypothetical protein
MKNEIKFSTETRVRKRVLEKQLRRWEDYITEGTAVEILDWIHLAPDNDNKQRNLWTC